MLTTRRNQRQTLVAFSSRMLIYVVLPLILSFNTFSGSLALDKGGPREFTHESGTFQNPNITGDQPLKTVRKIQGGHVDFFPFELSAGQSRTAVIDWHGIDLDVEVIKPDGTKMFPSVVPIRGWGPPTITILGENPGTYILEIRTIDQVEITGDYGLSIDASHSTTERDTKSFLALRAILEGDREKTKAAAIEKYLQALNDSAAAGELAGRAFALLRLGNASLAIKNATNAEKYYHELVQLREQLNEPTSLVYTLRQIGLDYRALSSPSVALEYYARALKLARDSRNRRAEAAVLYNTGFAHAVSGRMKVALEFYEQALAIQREIDEPWSEANTLMSIGGAHNRLADQVEALRHFEQVLPIFRTLKDYYRAAVALNNIGLAYDDLGRLQEARTYYLEAKTDYEALLKGDLGACRMGASNQILTICSSWANVNDNLGELDNTIGDPESALDVFGNTLQIRRVLNQPQSIGSTLSRICYSHVLQGKLSEALSECNEALTFNRKAEDLRGAGSTLTFLGMIYTALNRPEDATRCFDEALTLQRQASERRGEGIVLNQYGLFHVLTNQPDKALAKYEQALKLWRDTKDEDGETITLYNIARVERDKGDIAAGLSHIKQALQIIESRRAAFSSQKLSAAYFANKQNHYELEIDLQMLLAAANKNDRYISDALVANEHARARQLLDALGEARVTSSADQAQGTESPELANTINRRRELQASLRSKAAARTALLGRTHKPEELSSINTEITKLADEYDQLETKIRNLSPRYGALVKPVPVAASDIQSALDANTLLLEYALGEKRSYVFVVTSDTIKGFQLEPRDKIEAIANRLVQALTARNRQIPNETFQQSEQRVAEADREFSAAATELSRLVIDPVAPELGQKRLVIVADGALQYVPFSALSDSQQALRPLIASHEIVSLPSASVLALQRRELANRKLAPLKLAVLADPVFDAQDERVINALARGNPKRKVRPTNSANADQSPQNKSTTASPKHDNSTFVSALRDVGLNPDGSLRRLVFSRTEATDISRTVRGRDSLKALDFKASRATALSGELSKYQYVHFATHGLLSLEHPELSGIALSMVDEKGQNQDGYLRLYEIYNLNLPAELVVLSACETGVGKQIRGEGLIALTRGFMYAGAKRVVASLWKVDDSATAELMAQFYKEMFVNKRPPAEALKEAQMYISEQPRWRSPYYWAGFVLQGEWR